MRHAVFRRQWLCTLAAAHRRRFALCDSSRRALSASLGWRHTLADDPEAVHRFAEGDGFSVTGAPLAGDALILAAGIAFGIYSGTTIGLRYDGEVGTDAQTHAVQANWSSPL